MIDDDGVYYSTRMANLIRAGVFAIDVRDDVVSVISPDAITAERVGDDLEPLLTDDISRKEVAERGQAYFKVASK